MKLDFVCIGAQKAGTTTLHDILVTHPEIYLPPQKEVHFFNIREKYDKGLEHYFSTYFSTYNNERITGEINPNIQLENSSIDRLVESFGKELKVIFIIRNPMKRAFSHYLMTKGRGYETLSFLEAVKVEDSRIKNPQKHTNYALKELGYFEKNHFGYLHRSHYANTIEYLFSQFSKDNLKIIVFEDFIDDKKKWIDEILSFLEIPVSSAVNYNAESNTASAPKSTLVRNFVNKPSVFKKIVGKLINEKNRKAFRRKLSAVNSRELDIEQKVLSKNDNLFLYDAYFKEEILKLERLLGISLDRWKP